MSLPKISIVTPSFNQGAFIEQTICSVLDQGYPDLEYFVIDGGSNDNSVEIIKKYESRITKWVSEKDSGQSEAINKGLKMANGEIVSWLCSDDLYMPGALHKVAAEFSENPDCVMIHGKSVIFDAHGKEEIKEAERKDLSLRYFSVIPFPQPSSFFRKKLIDEQGLLREDLHFAMDFDLLIRAALNYKVTPVDDLLSKYRLHEKSKTVMQIKNFETEWIKVFSKFIRSVGWGESYVKELEHCGLYSEGNDSYIHKHDFAEMEFRTIILYFLDLMSHLSYQFLETDNAKRRLSLIKSLDRKFYMERKLGKISFRATYYPAGFINLIRKITR